MPEIEYKVEDKELQGMLKGILARLGTIKPAAELMGETVKESIETNFEKGGRPQKWVDLKKKTKRDRERIGKWPGRILVRKGSAGGLQGAITYTAMDDRVVVHANKEYARIHHYGSAPGKKVVRSLGGSSRSGGHSVTKPYEMNIPARPFMMIQDEDWAKMKAQLNDYIFGAER